MKIQDLNSELIGKKVKGIFLGMPVSGTITALVEDREPIHGELCGKGVRIQLDKPIEDDTGTYTEYESTARLHDEFGNLQYTELV